MACSAGSVHPIPILQNFRIQQPQDIRMDRLVNPMRVFWPHLDHASFLDNELSLFIFLAVFVSCFLNTSRTVTPAADFESV